MDALPLVTLVMPIRNEGPFIHESLGAALAQEYPADRLEVIVADGLSSDGSRETVEALRVEHPNLLVVDNPGRIVSTGLNLAIAQARGDIIVRVDGHTVIAPDYVRRCVEELETTGADNVGGPMVGIGTGAFAKAVVHATSCPFGVGGARFHYSTKREPVDTVYLGAWRRETFDKIGGFDEELVRNQDDELNYRLRKHGGAVLLCPTIKSRYVVRSRPAALASQYFQYGFWKVRVMQKHPEQMRLYHFVPPGFTLVLGLLALLSPLWRMARRALAASLAVYAMAVLVTTWTLAKRADRESIPHVPLTFPLMHFGYGAGFLWGLLRFSDRWRTRA